MWVFSGRLAFFKAVVKGTPDPTVTWERIKGDLNDREKYITRYDAKAKEHYLEVRMQHTNETVNRSQLFYLTLGYMELQYFSFDYFLRCPM